MSAIHEIYRRHLDKGAQLTSKARNKRSQAGASRAVEDWGRDLTTDRGGELNSIKEGGNQVAVRNGVAIDSAFDTSQRRIA